jgi:hypothetical protein
MAVIQTKELVIRLSKLVKGYEKSSNESLGGDTFSEELESIVSELIQDKTIIVEVVEKD